MLSILDNRILSSILKINSSLIQANNNKINPIDIINSFWKQYYCNEIEHMIGLFVNKNNNCSRVVYLSKGGKSSVKLSLYKFFLFALLFREYDFHIAHNHPSNICKPSKNDFQFTREMKSKCSVIGINFIDHYILTSDKTYSLEEKATIYYCK